MRTFIVILLLAASAVGQVTPPAPVSAGSASETVQLSKISPVDPTTLRVVKHVSLVLSILGLLVAIGWLAVEQAKGRAKAWTHGFLLDPTDELTFPTDSRIPPDHRTRLRSQLKEAGNPPTSTLLPFFSRRLWLPLSSDRLPAVFEQQQNISDNKVFAMKYLALKNEIFAYAVTGEALNYDIANPLPVVPGADAPPHKAPMGITSTPTEFLHLCRPAVVAGQRGHRV
jgi:hypothetical protein